MKAGRADRNVGSAIRSVAAGGGGGRFPGRSVTSGKAGGFHCEPLKAAVLAPDQSVLAEFLVLLCLLPDAGTCVRPFRARQPSRMTSWDASVFQRILVLLTRQFRMKAWPRSVCPLDDCAVLWPHWTSTAYETGASIPLRNCQTLPVSRRSRAGFKDNSTPVWAFITDVWPQSSFRFRFRMTKTKCPH